MSGEPPEDHRTRRIDLPGSGGPGDQPPDADPTRRVDPAAPGAPGGPDETMVAGQPVPGEADRTEMLDRPAWEAEVPIEDRGVGPGDAEDPDALDPDAEQDPPRRRGRDAAFGLAGLVLGIVLAFVVIALGTGDDEVATDDTAVSQEQVEALEAELADRDARIEELETQVAEAEAAAGERDEDIAAQQQALDDRASSLDQRAGALDDREDAIDRRESAVADRERAVDQREQELEQQPTEPAEPEQPADPDPPADGDGNGDGGIQLPEIDEEQVEGVIDRILDAIRNLF